MFTSFEFLLTLSWLSHLRMPGQWPCSARQRCRLGQRLHACKASFLHDRTQSASRSRPGQEPHAKTETNAITAPKRRPIAMPPALEHLIVLRRSSLCITWLLLEMSSAAKTWPLNRGGCKQVPRLALEGLARIVSIACVQICIACGRRKEFHAVRDALGHNLCLACQALELARFKASAAVLRWTFRQADQAPMQQNLSCCLSQTCRL